MLPCLINTVLSQGNANFFWTQLEGSLQVFRFRKWSEYKYSLFQIVGNFWFDFIQPLFVLIKIYQQQYPSELMPIHFWNMFSNEWIEYLSPTSGKSIECNRSLVKAWFQCYVRFLFYQMIYKDIDRVARSDQRNGRGWVVHHAHHFASMHSGTCHLIRGTRVRR